MLPHEKTLVERLKNEPFALIGINSDEPRDLKAGASDDERATATFENTRKILKDQGITWRNAIDGSTRGPLASKWNVQGWPTIYVIDANGKIRFKNVRDDDMEKAVLELLEEAKKH